MDISFPHLGINIEHLTSYISVFGFKIMFYGIIVGLGIVAGISLAAYLGKKDGLGEDAIYDLAIFEVPFCIIGARLYYVIFNWDYYGANPIQILNFRAGGLGIYGAVIMAMIVLIIYVKAKKVDPWRLADAAIEGLPIGQAIGRWGNFFNCEAFGGYTDSIFAMKINRTLVSANMITDQLNADMTQYQPDIAADYIQVHPTFLYESVWNLCLLTFMLIFRKHRKFKGEMLWIYMAGYGLGRFFIEGLRTDQLKLWGTNIAVSQVVSIILILIGSIAIMVGTYRVKTHPEMKVSVPAEATVVEKEPERTDATE